MNIYLVQYYNRESDGYTEEANLVTVSSTPKEAIKLSKDKLLEHSDFSIYNVEKETNWSCDLLNINKSSAIIISITGE